MHGQREKFRKTWKKLEKEFKPYMDCKTETLAHQDDPRCMMKERQSQRLEPWKWKLLSYHRKKIFEIRQLIII